MSIGFFIIKKRVVIPSNLDQLSTNIIMELYFPPFHDEYLLFLHFHYFLFIDQESLNKENKVRTIRLTTA